MVMLLYNLRSVDELINFTRVSHGKIYYYIVLLNVLHTVLHCQIVFEVFYVDNFMFVFSSLKLKCDSQPRQHKLVAKSKPQ